MPAGAFAWQDAPPAPAGRARGGEFDAVIIGSGLGGLACGAAFARKGYRALVLEQHDKAGGYATAFRRPGGFLFDVSLHSTTVGQRDGLHNLIGGLPEITEVEFVAHPHLYRAIFPQHDITVPQRDPAAYAASLARFFPQEEAHIQALLADMRALSAEVSKLAAARGQTDMSRFPQDFPTLYRNSQHTWGQMVDSRLSDPKLKAIVSALWAYYGLPPSRLSAFYYALPTLGYLEQGGYYPRGRSQTISTAIVKFIEARGGKVLTGKRVERVLAKGGTAYGVRCSGGQEFLARAVISNASPQATLGQFLEDPGPWKAYQQQQSAGFSPSLSCFQVFLGLKRDLAGELGLKDSEVFVEPGYDLDAGYEACRRADIEQCGFCVTLYDNIYPGYSPKGKNTLNLLCLQGYEPWAQFEIDYFAGRKGAYRRQKERMASILIERAERALLPGLSKSIEVKEIGTPLTNLRYTGNFRGAIYGWDQTVDNSGNRRIGHGTPVKGLYLAGAWSRPGHGYVAVIQSGIECCAQVLSERAL